ncbi:hypothetical protein [Leptospira meyeri]|uniref:hypothetical protein n=1 Tax=Leptospira meyeri TaxID=29508 RepID=UPI00223D4F5B|nr:hypothetical protein [Leptospira meyeri]MCW7490952.1 hypothetical protein [Leptospira meyeri]
MNQDNKNPTSNILKNGITEEEIIKAITLSGYPLQTEIVSNLVNFLKCEEEWSYIDRYSNELRSLDIFAQEPLYDFEKNKCPLIKPNLTLLIECKKSELPFVFFLSNKNLSKQSYPLTTGLEYELFKAKIQSSNIVFETKITKILELDNEEFINNIPTSLTFSKSSRSGKGIVLSGNEAYQNIVLPLISAYSYFESKTKPSSNAVAFNCHLTFLIAVIDAPLIGVSYNGNNQNLTLLPWIRLIRNESSENGLKSYPIDIIHKDFFKTYLNDSIIEYAKLFGKKIKENQELLYEGEGFSQTISQAIKNSFSKQKKRIIEG